MSVAVSAHAEVSPSLYQALHWRLIGPFRGGRVLTVAGIAGDSRHFYFGAVDGGVWATDDAGRTWHPIFDAEPAGSIGALALAPSAPNTIYVGTGEADMRSDIAHGNGLYKSIDGGKQCFQRRAHLEARMVFLPSDSRSEKCRPGLCDGHHRVALR